MPQRRRRIYIVAYHKNSPIYKKLSKYGKKELIERSGIISSAFPASSDTGVKKFRVSKDFDLESKNFNEKAGVSPFKNSGVMFSGQVYSCKTSPEHSGLSRKTLGEILSKDCVPDEFYIDMEKPIKKEVHPQIDGTEIVVENVGQKWKYLKGPKKELKHNKAQGYKYKYSEGNMIFPDPLNKPSRTIITGEGGASASRFKHIVKVGAKYRRLTPVELERLNMFPVNHTLHDDVSNSKRAFFMGNALVVGVVERIGQSLISFNNV